MLDQHLFAILARIYHTGILAFSTDIYSLREEISNLEYLLLQLAELVPELFRPTLEGGGGRDFQHVESGTDRRRSGKYQPKVERTQAITNRIPPTL